MDPDRLREWRRWAASERDGLDDEADAAFRALFERVPDRIPVSGFRDRVLQAAARSAVRRARATKAWIAAAAAVAIVLGVALLIWIPQLLGAAFNLVISAVVSTTLAFGRGLDVWTVLAQVVRAIGSVVNTPQVTYALVGLGAIAIAALYALQRVLEVGERSSS